LGCSRITSISVGHSADEIILNDGRTFQQAINEGDFCLACYVEQESECEKEPECPLVCEEHEVECQESGCEGFTFDCCFWYLNNDELLNDYYCQRDVGLQFEVAENRRCCTTKECISLDDCPNGELGNLGSCGDVLKRKWCKWAVPCK